jgi:hypothetical protein
MLVATVCLAQDEAASLVTYDKVSPILKKRCGSCHAAERPRGGLDLTSLAGIKAGSTSGEVAKPGSPDRSALYTLAAHLDAPKMPPNAPKIPQREIEIIELWIADGMADVAGKKPGVAMASEEASPIRIAEPLPLVEAVRPLTRASAITAMELRPRTSLLAVSGDQQIAILDYLTRTPLKAFPFPEGEVFSLRFSPDGELLVAGGGVSGAEGVVVVFEVETGKRILEIKEEGDAVLTADLSPTKDRLAWGGSDKTIKLYSLAEKKVIATLAGYTDWLLKLKFSPDGLLLGGADRFGGVRVWEAKSGKEFWVLRGHTGPVGALDWSPDGDELLTAGEDGTVRLYNMHSGKQTRLIEPEIGAIQATQWNPNGAIVLASRGKRAAIISSDGQVRMQFELTDEACEVAMDGDQRVIIVADAAGIISPFAITGKELTAPFTLPLSDSAIAKTTPWPKRTRAAPEPTELLKTTPTTNSADQSDDLAIAAQEAEAAVKAAEASLVKLRENAARLQKLLSARDAK